MDQVSLRGRLLATIDEVEETPLRWRRWRTLRVAHTVAGAGLRVEIDGVALLSAVHLGADFAPELSWRFGFGARSGPNPKQQDERHDVRRCNQHGRLLY